MATELTPHVWAAIGTAIAGVLLFGLAPRLPSLLPEWFTRYVGVFTVMSACGTIWFNTESTPITALVAVICLAAMAVIHLTQTRRAKSAQDTPDPSTPATK